MKEISHEQMSLIYGGFVLVEESLEDDMRGFDRYLLDPWSMARIDDF